METGKWYVVYMYLDEQTERLVATTRFNRFLQEGSGDLKVGDEVDLILVGKSDLGMNVIINQRYRGLIFSSDLIRPVQPGSFIKGFIKRIKPDQKIDVSLQAPGFAGITSNADKILSVLREKGGFLPFTDKSDPSRIQAELEMSKKTFKKAVGLLYKQRLITLEAGGIRLA